jgi:hypothetical protein
MAELYAEGGNACEYFFHILANPGDEVSFWVAGKQLSEPAVSWQTHLRATLDELYGVKSTANGDLMDLFVRAEDAYLKHRPFMRSGTIAMEPLIEGDFQSPVYLIKNLGREQRKEYRQDIERIAAGFRKLAPDVPDKVRMQKIVRCLNSVQKDLNSLS